MTNIVYLDNAATLYPKSDGVFEAVKKAFYGCGNGGRGGHPLSFAAADTVYGCRESLAKLFGTESENVALCSGATLALNMAIKGLYKKGMTVICSLLEHNAVLRPLYSLAAKGYIKLRFFSPSLVSDEETVAAFRAALTKDVALGVFTHASNVCGLCLPVKELCALCRDRGITTVVDCAQTAGHIPINIRELDGDVLCIAGHKGLGGPMGTGALIVNPHRLLFFDTLIEGGTGVASRERTMPGVLPERLEAGTVNITGIAGLAAAVRELAIDVEREKALRQKLIEGLRAIKGVSVYGTEAAADYMPLVLFNVGDIPSDTVAEKLAARGICVRGGLHCAPLAHVLLKTGAYGGVRASIGRYNSEKDIHALLAATEEIAHGKI